MSQNPASLEATVTLLEMSFQRNISSDLGYIALDVAAQLLLKETVELMLCSGANINQQLHNGESLLHILAGLLHLNVLPMVEMLIARGIDVHLVDSSGNTCLHSAFQHGHKMWTERFADMLMCAGVSVNARNGAGETCLSVAIEHYLFKTTWLLDLMTQSPQTMYSLDSVAQHATDLSILTEWFKRNGGDLTLLDAKGESAITNLERLNYIFSHKEDTMHVLDHFSEGFEN